MLIESNSVWLVDNSSGGYWESKLFNVNQNLSCDKGSQGIIVVLKRSGTVRWEG